MNKLFSAFNMNNPIEKILFLVGGVAFVGGFLFYAFQSVGGMFKSDGISLTAVFTIFGVMFFLYSLNGMFLKIKHFLDFYAESYFERFCQCKERWADVNIKEAQAIKAKNEAVHTLHSGSVGIVHIDHKRDKTTFLQPQHHKYDQRIEVADGDAPGSDQIEYKPLMPFIEPALAVYLWGEQGAGKTTLLNQIARNRLSKLEKVIAIDPHYTLNPDYPKGVEVIGAGRDYNSIDETMFSLIREMNRRYNAADDLYPITIIMDEYTGLRKHCGNAKEFIELALTEFRKVNMKTVFGAHSRRAKIINLGGQYDMSGGVVFVGMRLDPETGERYATVEKNGDKHLCRVPWMGEDYALNAQNGQKKHDDTPLKQKGRTDRTDRTMIEMYEPDLNDDRDSDVIRMYRKGNDRPYSLANQAYGHSGGKQAQRVKTILSKIGVSL